MTGCVIHPIVPVIPIKLRPGTWLEKFTETVALRNSDPIGGRLTALYRSDRVISVAKSTFFYSFLLKIKHFYPS
jgi:hypothetical protein